MLKQTIEISGLQVPFCASAAVPRMYRIKFKRDIFKDLARLQASYAENAKNDAAAFGITDLEVFENVAYIMAYHADHSIPSDIDEWLSQFDVFSIYEVLPELLSLWGDNFATDVASKKNLAAVAAR